MTKLVKLGLASIVSAGALYAGTYNVDKVHSNVGFKVKHMMISNVSGKFNDFSGSFEYDEKTKTVTSLTGTAAVKSIDTDNQKRDDHLRSSDFFAADKYPELTFKLERIDGDDAYGKLTMRGVTKDVKFDFENNGSVVDSWGNTRVGLALEGKVNRMDYGIKYNSLIEAGGVAISENVKINIEIQGILAK